MNKEERERRLETILKPCPFCGRKVSDCEIEAISAGVYKLNVSCVCGAEVKIEAEKFFTVSETYIPKNAIRIWNTRNGEESEESEEGLNE